MEAKHSRLMGTLCAALTAIVALSGCMDVETEDNDKIEQAQQAMDQLEDRFDVTVDRAAVAGVLTGELELTQPPPTPSPWVPGYQANPQQASMAGGLEVAAPGPGPFPLPPLDVAAAGEPEAMTGDLEIAAPGPGPYPTPDLGRSDGEVVLGPVPLPLEQANYQAPTMPIEQAQYEGEPLAPETEITLPAPEPTPVPPQYQPEAQAHNFSPAPFQILAPADPTGVEIDELASCLNLCVVDYLDCMTDATAGDVLECAVDLTVCEDSCANDFGAFDGADYLAN